jgi:hypothetical protein
MFEAPPFANRLRIWWPWIALSLGVLIVAVGGLLFTT